MTPRTRLWLLRSSLVVVSAYLSALAAQLSLPIVFGIPIRVPFDTPLVRSTIQIASELRSSASEVVVLVYPGIWLDQPVPGKSELFPLSGLSRRLTVFCEEQPHSAVMYVSDRHGFRNDAQRWDTEPVPLAAIGDSFTQGACMEGGRGFVELIGRQAGPVLNLGMSGDGPLLELATLKEYLPPRAPRLVLWFFYPGNDLFDLDRERRDPLLLRYLEDGFSQHLPTRQDEIDDRVGEWLTEAEARLDPGRLVTLIDGEEAALQRLIEFTSLRPLRRMAAAASPPERDYAFFGRVLHEARSSVERWGGQLVFVYLPDHIAVSRLPAAKRRARDSTLDVIGRLHIPVFDVEAETRSMKRSELFYYSTSHYSERGNEVVARVVTRHLAALAH